MKTMTLELLVNSLSLAFISSADMVGAAVTEGVAVAVVPLIAADEADDFEYFATVLDNSGGFAPSTRSTTFPS
jgi:hypothetical protein